MLNETYQWVTRKKPNESFFVALSLALAGSRRGDGCRLWEGRAACGKFTFDHFR